MAFDSTLNRTLPKPTISFKVNDWVLNVTLPKPVLNTNWLLNVVLPKITLSAVLTSNYLVNSTLPKITIVSSYSPDNLYGLSSRLKIPSLFFEVYNSNVYSLASTLPKPTVVSLLGLDILGIVDYRLPSITVSFNAAFSATTTKQTWVFNTITTAHSRYTNYDFNSFFKLGADNYGINTNGSIYKLTGLKDFVGEATEVNIDAEIDFPATTYEEQTLKSCSDAILYGRGNGEMEVQVVLDEQQARTGYSVHFDNREGMHRNRVKIPKGLKGNVWQFKLKNVDGSWFDINMFEVFVKTMQRLKW
jgi:hypothetical protein